MKLKMWVSTSTIVLLVLCSECSLLLNVSAESDVELTSSSLGRASEWNCASDVDCTASNSSCINGYCECPGGYIYNTEFTACLPVATAYGDECTETIQCSTYLLSGSVCADGVCTCSEGYHYTRGRCYASAGLGEACSADVNCYVWADTEAASCVGGVCVCSDGFYPREYRMCRRIGYAVGDECAIDLDCQFEDGFCDTSTYVCAVPETIIDTTTETISETTIETIINPTTETIQETTTAAIIETTTETIINPTTETIINPTTETIIETTTETIINPTTETILETTTETIQETTTEAIIEATTETIINPTTETIINPTTETIINPTTETIQETTTETIIETTTETIIETTTETTINPATETITNPTTETIVNPTTETISGTSTEVTIDTTTINLDTSRITRTLGRADENAAIGTECVSDDDCTAIANSRCGSAGICICNRAYFASDDLSTCIPEVGEDCSSNEEVLIENSICRNETWSCSYSTVASINQRICRKSTKNYNWSCLHDEQCYIFGPDSSCQSKRCLCNEGSHLVDDLKFCWVNRGISESCRADEDCYVEGLDVELSCINSICTCPNGTSPSSDKTMCKDDNAELGDVCEDDDDCTVASSICVDSICGCPENYLIVNDYCAAGINATCSANSDCIVENSECTETNVCECADNFISDASDSCLPVADYGEECQSDLQCSAVLSNTYCSVVTTTSDENSNSSTTSSCACDPDYHYRFDICYKKTAIGETCTSLGDCYVEDGIEDVVCRKGVCACSWDSSSDTLTSCSRVSSDATIFFLSTWLSLILIGVKIFLV